MNETLGYADLLNLPKGSKVNDGDDIWIKQASGLWSAEFTLGSEATYYADWNSERLSNAYAVTLVTEADYLPVLDIKPALDLRSQTLLARENFDSEGLPGYSEAFFDDGVREGWFTDKFFEDWATGEQRFDG